MVAPADQNRGLPHFIGTAAAKLSGDCAKLAHTSLCHHDRQLVDRVLELRDASYVPYSNKARGAVVVAFKPWIEHRNFEGVQIDNASFGGTISAERSAISAAVSAAFAKSPSS